MNARGGTVDLVTNPIDDLKANVKGEVITPDDATYDDARRLMMGRFDPRPLAIVRAAHVEDIAYLVGHARESGIDLAVRSGGHSGAGHSGVDGGIVLDLAAFNDFDLDVEARTAWAGAGLTAGEYTAAAHEHGLATGFGDTATVGLGGLTLGGGVGYLSRKFGLTVDDVLAAELVTADGELVRVDAENEPDLFWAIRGGGGNFGVATRFQYRLHEVGQVLGGLLVLPATRDVITSFVDEALAAPDELSTIANIMPAPQLPFLPPEAEGQLVVLAMLVWSGDLDEGERVIAPFRAMVTPLADFVHPMPYPEVYPPEDPDYRPIAAARNLFLDRVDAAAADTILEYLSTGTSMMRVAQLRPLGGAIARVPVGATAYAHRRSPVMVNVAAVFGDVAEAPAYDAWVDEFAGALRQDDQGVYVNFLTDEGDDRVRAAYPGQTWDRLVDVKRRYDPSNVFHLNQNIRP
jgi:hypothetical protein